MADLRIKDSDVDTSFKCYTCDTPAYVDSEGDFEDDLPTVRSVHPGHLNNRPLYWINPYLCDACYDALLIIYRNKPSVSSGNNVLDCVQTVMKTPESRKQYQEDKDKIMAASLCTERKLLGSEDRGVRIRQDDCNDTIKKQLKYTFYPDKVYEKFYSGDASDNGHTAGLDDGVKGVFVYDFPEGVVCNT